MVQPVTSPDVVPQQANNVKRPVAAKSSSVQPFKDHLNAQASADGHRVNSALKSSNSSDIKAHKPTSRVKLNQLQEPYSPDATPSGTDIAVKARELAKEFEAYFLKEMWKDIDGLKFSGGQDMDMVFDIWSENLIEDWFSPKEDEEGGDLAKQMAEQIVAKYRKQNPQLQEK